MFDWPLHRDFSLLFAIGEVGSFTCIGCDSPIHGTDGLESPPKDLAMRIKRLAKGRYCRGGIWTHAEPPVWKFAVYTLALRPLGHDSSSGAKHGLHNIGGRPTGYSFVKLRSSLQKCNWSLAMPGAEPSFKELKYYLNVKSSHCSICSKVLNVHHPWLQKYIMLHIIT